VLVWDPAYKELRKPAPEALEIGQVQINSHISPLAGCVDVVHIRQFLVVIPHFSEPHILVAHVRGNITIKEVVLAVEV
jgi:hypothetical protein